MYGFSQPIQLRFNELISGVRSDVAIKIFGDDLSTLLEGRGRGATRRLHDDGAADVKTEQLSGLPILSVQPRRIDLARYGLTVADVQDAVSAAIGGKETGLIYEGDARYPLEVRLAESMRVDPDALIASADRASQRQLRAAGGGRRYHLQRGTQPDLA